MLGERVDGCGEGVRHVRALARTRAGSAFPEVPVELRERVSRGVSRQDLSHDANRSDVSRSLASLKSSISQRGEGIPL